MNKTIIFLIILLMCISPMLAVADEDQRLMCGDVKTILSVADFNGNGMVDQEDVSLIAGIKEKELYYALYDMDTNGKIDDVDIEIVEQQIGLKSSPLDQQLALLFNRNKQYQLIDNVSEINAMGYITIASSLAGHGEHWTDVVSPLEKDYLRPNGLNISKSHNSVSGVYWGVDAIPVFEHGATDYPTPGGEWENQRVVSFAGAPPKFFASPDEHWHTHAGLCITWEELGNGPEIVLNQHMTFAQCQQQPSLAKIPGTDYNIWANIWMLHAWIFDLNPNGIFANTHPCIDPDSPMEHTINGDREVPPFFAHH